MAGPNIHQQGPQGSRLCPYEIATADAYDASRNTLGTRAREEADQIGNIIGKTTLAQAGEATRELLHHKRNPCGHGCFDEARSHSIGCNALRGEMVGKGFDETDQARFGSAVIRLTEVAG